MAWIDGAMCERCWIEMKGTWEDAGVDDDGLPLEKLVAVREPVRIREPEIEICVRCELPTIWGVYVRWDKDPEPGAELESPDG
jgi:hypothetical protein